ncbi:type IX secretion system ring subunit PorN/GldN [Aureispira anguillae]|uniref:Gliding motility protein GldN n=1 Tax=Aureispira anguillae TaxID=2864201 RepID=A0A915YKG4_9BACT|nr:gliding motility protein GldN [Aureispira anguillae]BDS14864.1 gliding motility protein GldN [Aureispira anguillae]
MNSITKITSLLVAGLLVVTNSIDAQNTYMTEAGVRVTEDKKACKKPRDGFYDRYLHKEKMPLPYDYIHEKDVFWEKRIWREVDTREKMNHTFVSPHGPLITTLLDAAKEGNITLYSSWDEKFSIALSQDEIQNLMSYADTISIYDPETLRDSIVVVTNEFNWENVQKYRIKEVWYFDEETSTLGVRILGIAPIINRYDDNGEFLNSGPMFWAYYPELRKTFAQTETFNPLNDGARLSWDDLFEARLFSSYIIKENNIHDRRIKDYAKNGTNALLESERIHSEIFNFEHDLWSY